MLWNCGLKRTLKHGGSGGIRTHAIESVSPLHGLAVLLWLWRIVRICIDPRPLNTALKRERYQLPILKEYFLNSQKQENSRLLTSSRGAGTVSSPLNPVSSRPSQPPMEGTDGFDCLLVSPLSLRYFRSIWIMHWTAYLVFCASLMISSSMALEKAMKKQPQTTIGASKISFKGAKTEALSLIQTRWSWGWAKSPSWHISWWTRAWSLILPK